MKPETTRSEAETVALGRRLGTALAPGDVVLLDGPLGAGKTAFVRGLAEGLGCAPDDVSSPTFTLVQEYPGRTVLLHVDLYRVSPADVADLGLEELGEEAVLAVEWSDRWTTPPADAVRVHFAITGDTTREIALPGSIRRGSSELLS